MHLTFLNQGITSLVKFKELLPLFATTYVYFSIKRTLEDCAKITESMLHILDVNHSWSEIFEVMHDQLLLIRNKYSNPMLFWKKLKTSLSHFCALFDLLKTTQI